MPCSLDWEIHCATLYPGRAVRIAGIDEAGRGPLAGPVVAAAVILPGAFSIEGLDDSKKLTGLKRELLFEKLTSDPAVSHGLGTATVSEIDARNILRASHEAMRRAVAALPAQPDHALIDGLPVHPFPIPQTALVKGDGISLSIAAASILAKVTRDRMMLELDLEYPQYGFAKHKGYGTAFHLEQLREHGPCPAHRRSFAPVSQTCFFFGTA